VTSEAVRGALEADPTIDITTIGRRSGQRRRIEIWMMVVDDRFFITGTPGRRDWLANLRANGELVVHLKDGRTDLPAHATEVTDEPARRLVLEHLTTRWYRGQSSIEDLIANAPMVEVRFDAEI
jgi:deazaflavin-dependent oxidoreductase (nitroreductase family)